MQRLILDSQDFSLLWSESRQPAVAQETAVAALSCSLLGFGDFVRRAPPYDGGNPSRTLSYPVGEHARYS